MKVTNWYNKNKDKVTEAECSISAEAFPEVGKLRIQSGNSRMEITLSPVEMYDLLMQLDNCCKRWAPAHSEED